ncbi:MAG: B12-binding domain-containing protein [Treponema sp.]|jgi:methanogenic corrinoid protein MtbC1|nr:B12-binding domain-containing protein [Treponema sp.]
MEKIGVKFKNNEVFVPEVLIAARALNRQAYGATRLVVSTLE